MLFYVRCAIIPLSRAGLSAVCGKVFMKIKRFKFRPIGIVVASFVIVIFAGAGLLCIPAAVRSGKPDFLTALFTATSATCVTGHTMVDPYTYFTGFGQAVILLLIQIGGLGFITIISLFMLYIKKDVTLSDRKLAMQSAGGLKMAGVKGLLKYIFIGTFALEFLGAVLLSVSFVRDYGWGMGIWQAVFTSVSSFCNAGFSLTGAGGDLSLAGYSSDPLFLLTVMALITIGGLGFYVWYDVITNRFRPARYSLHTKVVLISTGGILLIAWALFMAFEWNNAGTIGNMNAGDKLLNSLFFAVTPRTAGHYTVDMNYSWEHGATFSASPELQTMINGWYANGTEIVFACGGSMFQSISAAASANEGYVIGVDVDQSGESEYVLTSAMKGLADAVQWAVGHVYDETFDEIGGTTTSLGAEDNAVQLPTSDESWRFETFTVEEYEALYQQMVDGTLVVDDDYSKLETTEWSNVTLNVI